MVAPRHQLHHDAGSGRRVQIRVAVAVALADSIPATGCVEHCNGFGDAVDPHREMLESSRGVGSQVVAEDRRGVIVLLDDLDLLIARIGERCRKVGWISTPS